MEAICEACGELPGWVWNMETLRVAWRTFTFFPAAREVHALLSAVADRRMRGLAHVRLLATARPAPEPEQMVASPGAPHLRAMERGHES